MLREAMALSRPNAVALVEMLFFETPRGLTRKWQLNSASPRLHRFTRQKSIERLRRQLDELGSTDARNARQNSRDALVAELGLLATDAARRKFLAAHSKINPPITIENCASSSSSVFA